MSGITNKDVVITGARGWDRLEALPVFRRQGFGHFVNTASTAAHRIVPNMAAYAATKTAVRRTNFADSMTNLQVRAQMVASMDKSAMPPEAIARAIAFAIEQPADVDVGEIIVRPTAQS